MKNKLKGKSVNGRWTPKRWQRRLPMPQFPSMCAAGRSADEVAKRCNLFRWMKRINKIPRTHMKGGVLEQILGSGIGTQHVTND